MEKFGFIEAAYAAAVLVVGGLTAWVLLDHRTQRRKLAALEMQGFTRGSDTSRPPVTPGQQQRTKERA
jgi:heme exporter protein D